MSGAVTLPDSVATVPDVLAFWAERTPQAPALIVAGGATITYADLWRATRSVAHALRSHGVARQDRVVLLLPEGADLAVVLLGTMSAAIAMPLDAAMPLPELETALLGFHPKAAIVDPAAAALRAHLVARGVTVCAREPALAPGAPGLACGGTPPPGVAAAPPHPDDIAVVGHTSGTTGRAKRVPRTHGGIVVSGRQHRDTFGLSGADRALGVAPLTLSLGRTALFHGLATGSSLIFPPSLDPRQILETIAREGPTWMHAAAGFLELFARYLRERGDPPPGRTSLRLIRVTAAAIAPAVCAELERALGAPVLPSYSSSEAGAIATALPPPAPRKPGSVGRPVQEIRVVGDDERDGGGGAEGEIWVRGAKLFPGYLDDAELNAAVFAPGGWFRTGDVGYLDEDGFLFLTGRLSELINRGGAKIAPAEIDAVLRAHPAVREAATFAIPHERLGQELAVAVMLEADQTATARELRRWMLDHLAMHKSPRHIWFAAADDLPRTPSGKIRRGELAKRWEGR